MCRSVVYTLTGQTSTGERGTLRRLHLLLAKRGKPHGRSGTDSTGCTAGQYPRGRGRGSKRRPSGHRRDRVARRGGEIQPERVLTSHRLSRKRRKKAMAHTVRTVGPPPAPNDRGSPHPAWYQIDWKQAVWTVQSRRFWIFRLVPHSHFPGRIREI
jgi:hypothetical protein